VPLGTCRDAEICQNPAVVWIRLGWHRSCVCLLQSGISGVRYSHHCSADYKRNGCRAWMVRGAEHSDPVPTPRHVMLPLQPGRLYVACRVSTLDPALRDKKLAAEIEGPLIELSGRGVTRAPSVRLAPRRWPGVTPLGVSRLSRPRIVGAMWA